MYLDVFRLEVIDRWVDLIVSLCLQRGQVDGVFGTVL